MSLLLIVLLHTTPLNYIDIIYDLQNAPLDSALTEVYTMSLSDPDSLLYVIGIVDGYKRIRNMGVDEFTKEFSSIDSAQVLIRKLFYDYSSKYTVYDTVFKCYYTIFLTFGRGKDIKRLSIKYLQKYGQNPEILHIIALEAQNKFPKIADMAFSMLLKWGKSLNDNIKLFIAKKYMDKNNYTTAYKFLKSVKEDSIAKDLQYDYYNLKASLFEHNRQYDSAITYYTKLTEISNGNVSSKVFYRIASLFEKLGDYQSALSILLPIASQRRFNYAVREKLGIAYLMTGKTDSAMENLLIAKSLVKNDPEVYYYLARCLIYKGYYNDALSTLKRAIKMNRSYDYLLLKAFLLNSLNQYEASLRTLLEIKGTGLKDPYYMYLAGTTFKKTGRLGLALKYLSRSVNMDSTKYNRFIPLLSLLVRKHDTEEVRWALKKALLAKGPLVDETFDMAFAASFIGNLHLTDSLYTSLIVKNPNNPIYYNNLGYSMLQLGGDVDSACKLIQKALKMSPSDPLYLDSYGWCLYKKGEVKEAMKYIEKAHKMLKRDREITNHYRIIKKAIYIGR